MSKENDGGGAFPATKMVEEKFMDEHGYGRTRTVNRPHGGMSLRDYFAAKAMQAIIAKSPFLAEPEDFTPYEKTAIGAYDYADAMLKSRGE